MQLLPDITHTRFSLIRVRSPLLTESLLLSLPVGTEMFHFPTFPLPALYIQAGVTRSARRLAGFPHSDTLGSQPVYRLPEAYRRFPRPSSAPDAKASTMRSYTLITPKKIGCKMCVRKFHTKISQEKSHYITTQTKFGLLMLASTIRFSNHYQTPPTPTQPKAAGLDGLVLLVETTPNHCWLVCDSRTQ